MKKKKIIVLGVFIVTAIITLTIILKSDFFKYKVEEVKKLSLEEQFNKYLKEYEIVEETDIREIGHYFDDSLIVSCYEECDDYTLAGGGTYIRSIEEEKFPWIAMLDSDNNIVWEKTFDNGNNSEEVLDITVKEEKIYAVGTTYKNVTITVLDMDGEVLNYIVTDIECGPKDIEYMDGYYYINTFDYEDEDKVYMVDESGESKVVLVCDDEAYRYVIEDMMEYNGKMYFSCYGVPHWSEYSTHHYEYEKITEMMIAKSSFATTYFDDDEIKALKDNYTAYLYMFNAETDECKNVCLQNGAVGDDLRLDSDGNLIWDVLKYEKGYYSMATSAFSIVSANSIYEYKFDANNKSLSKADTGKVTLLYR